LYIGVNATGVHGDRFSAYLNDTHVLVQALLNICQYRKATRSRKVLLVQQNTIRALHGTRSL
jgi:hypothetical protein